ncbi:hypothetical protein, partial [Miniimonas arenae]|uniref:hypothetical protein n=1 Tax=Miniimonas arenae TaxID=676201 RepID=UPI001C58A0A9
MHLDLTGDAQRDAGPGPAERDRLALRLDDGELEVLHRREENGDVGVQMFGSDAHGRSGMDIDDVHKSARVDVLVGQA